MNFKNFIILTVGIVFGSHLVLSSGTSSAYLSDNIMQTIHSASSDYVREMNYTKQPMIDGTPVTLGALLYALTIQEGTKPTHLNMRTNNPGNIKAKQGLKVPVSYSSKDNTVGGGRPTYGSLYDGYYEMSHLVVREDYLYKGNITYNALFCYINGCKADPNSYHSIGPGTKREYTLRKLSQLKKMALDYEAKYGNVSNTDDLYKSTSKEEVEETIEKAYPKKECHFVAVVKNADYIQVDTGDGEYYSIMETNIPSNGLKIYNCYGDRYYR